MSAQAPRTDWREDIAPDEQARFEQLAQTLRTLQDRSSGRTGQAGRALHRKGHLGAHASFEVLGDLPDEVRTGLAARPATYRAYVRFSNGSFAHNAYPRPDVRGIAVKLLGVTGKKLIPGLEDKTTQDLLAIHGRATPFANAEDFVAAVYAGRSPALALPRMIGAFGPAKALRIIKKFVASVSEKIPTLSRRAFFSALPVRWGEYAAKYAFLPAGSDGADTPPERTPDYLGQDLAARLKRAPIVYDFAVQLYRDPVRTPIEDGSVEWLEADAPFQRVGRLTLPAQDVLDARGRKLGEYIETLSFDPWHELVEHRPLGTLMRARHNAYRVSTQNRHAAAEPDGSERFD